MRLNWAVFPDINSEFNLLNANRRRLCATINNNQKTDREAAMRRFMMTGMALMAFAAIVATAQAQTVRGGQAVHREPTRNGNQCFTYSPGDGRDGRFGFWGACPQPAGVRRPSGSVSPDRQLNGRGSDPGCGACINEG